MKNGKPRNGHWTTHWFPLDFPQDTGPSIGCFRLHIKSRQTDKAKPSKINSTYWLSISCPRSKRKPHNLLVFNILPFSLSLYIEREKERDIHIHTHTHHPRCKGVGIGIKEYDNQLLTKTQTAVCPNQGHKSSR